MSRSIIKRIEKIERPTLNPRWLATVFDEALQLYSGQDIGGSLTPEAFEKWCAKQDKDTQVIIVRVCENKPKIVIENHVSQNGNDLLQKYEEIVKKKET
jgi:hypothetical protein